MIDYQGKQSFLSSIAGAFLFNERELVENPRLGLIWEGRALAEVAAPRFASK